MQNSMVIFTFLFLTGNTLLGKIHPKIQNYQFNSNMQNLVVMFTFFSIFEWKYPFWVNLAPKKLELSV